MDFIGDNGLHFNYGQPIGTAMTFTNYFIKIAFCAIIFVTGLFGLIQILIYCVLGTVIDLSVIIYLI